MSGYVIIDRLGALHMREKTSLDWPSSLASNFHLEVAFQFYSVQWV
jgi:hypothetical protein